MWIYLKKNHLVATFLSLHLVFAVFLGRLFALAPDEAGYLYTFNHLYGGNDPYPQYNSGWITAPKPFLWLTYFPSRALQVGGLSDYLAIRFLSILLAGLSLGLLIGLYRSLNGESKKVERLIFLFFFIPSIFLWTSVGLREPFIILEFTLLLVGLNHFFNNRKTTGLIFLVIGSYGLMSTKNYLWICMVGSLLTVVAYLTFRKVLKRQILTLSAALILIPSILFASTTSVGALEFFIHSVFHADIVGSAGRSGDSIVQVAISKDQAKNGGLTGNSNSLGGGHLANGNNQNETVITFHGDTTLILLHFFIVDHPNSVFTKVLRFTGIKGKLDEIWRSKLNAGLIKKSSAALPDTSSLSGYILKPASVHNPITIIRPAFLFLFGPIPLLDQGGLALNTVSLESPLWWLLYLIVGVQLVRYGRKRAMKDPVLLFAGVFFLTLVAFSALVEVNLGTSFRHRSILLVPLLVMYIRARSKPVAIDN